MFIVTNVCLSVCLSVILVHLLLVLGGMKYHLTRTHLCSVDPSNTVLNMGPDPSIENGSFGGWNQCWV